MKIFVLFLALFSVALADTASTVPSNAPVTFSLTVDGTPPFTYQWRKNGVAIAGATAATYVLPGATVADTGSYDCVIANSAGSTISDKGVLTVNPPVVAPANGHVLIK